MSGWVPLALQKLEHAANGDVTGCKKKILNQW